MCPRRRLTRGIEINRRDCNRHTRQKYRLRSTLTLGIFILYNIWFFLQKKDKMRIIESVFDGKEVICIWAVVHIGTKARDGRRGNQSSICKEENSLVLSYFYPCGLEIMKGITDATPRVLFCHISWNHKKERTAHRTFACSSLVAMSVSFQFSHGFPKQYHFHVFRKNSSRVICVFIGGKRRKPLRLAPFVKSMGFPKYWPKKHLAGWRPNPKNLNSPLIPWCDIFSFSWSLWCCSGHRGIHASFHL